ncbi:MAG: glycine--tRNA ligase subunit beta [Candidatus Polarisedimenticolia bacterium]
MSPQAATQTFLLEVGCEEIPAGMLPPALDDLTRRILEELGGPDRLGGEIVTPAPLGGPRRLVARITGIRAREEDRVVLATGPPVSAAFDPQGRPTKAALGFARAQGVDPEMLERVAGDKGEVVAARRNVTGRSALEVLAEACPRVLGAMRFPKMMKWGDRGHVFVRPVHWIVALLDGEVVPFEFVGVRSGRLTYGHRFLAPGPHEISSAREYETVLRDRGRVLAVVAERRERLAVRRDEAAAARKWRARPDDALLEELTFLTEWPGIVAGHFPKEYLEIPEPVIVTAMRHHQKYFPAEEADGSLAPGFLAAINQERDESGDIQRGNEWVLKARLADARFFWGEDRKKTLEERRPDLARLTFHEKLGSNLSRAERLESLSAALASWSGASTEDIALVRQAARLAKCDLTTGMVGEFPELQGVMGGIYARHEKLPEGVARAIEEHYLPVSPQGARPATRPGALLALADKMDLLAGCFALGLIPKGSADPYGLRRAAMGICLLLVRPPLAESSATPPLRRSLDEALRGYGGQGIAAADPEATLNQMVDFVAQRLRFLLEEDGHRFDTARAVLASGFDAVGEAWRRARALTNVRGPAHEQDFLALATSAKRIRNILAQAGQKGIALDGAVVEAGRMTDAEERDLHAAVTRVGTALEQRIAEGDYEQALRDIASLRPQVDRFFDKVLVMAPDEGVRRNRLALLQGLLGLLSRVADFSEIVVEGDMSARSA